MEAPVRRRRRTTVGNKPATGKTSSAPARRRRTTKAGSDDPVTELKDLVNQLIKENRTLKRQVAKLQESAGSAAGRKGPGLGHSIAAIERRLRKALDSGGQSKKAVVRRRRSTEQAA